MHVETGDMLDEDPTTKRRVGNVNYDIDNGTEEGLTHRTAGGSGGGGGDYIDINRRNRSTASYTGGTLSARTSRTPRPLGARSAGRGPVVVHATTVAQATPRSARLTSSSTLPDFGGGFTEECGVSPFLRESSGRADVLESQSAVPVPAHGRTASNYGYSLSNNMACRLAGMLRRVYTLILHFHLPRTYASHPPYAILPLTSILSILPSSFLFV